MHVTGPDGKEVPAQISDGKVIFLASVPSVGYAVYDVQPGAGADEHPSQPQGFEQRLENRLLSRQV